MSERAVKENLPVSEPKLKVLETNFADMRVGQTMVVATPELIREASGKHQGHTSLIGDLIEPEMVVRFGCL